MKMTIAISSTRRVGVEPCPQGVFLTMLTRKAEGEWDRHPGAVLSLDKAGALIFALEQAAEAVQIGQERDKALDATIASAALLTGVLG